MFMKIMTLQNVWSHVFYLFSRKKNSILQISMLPCLKISFKTCLSHFWYLVIRKSLILSQVSHRGSGVSIGVTGKNVRKLLKYSSTGQKCQKISLKVEYKNVRNVSRTWFKKMIFFSDLLFYWHHQNFLTFLDPLADIFVLWSIIWLVCTLETKKYRTFQKFSDIFNSNPAWALMNLHLNRRTGVILKCVA